MIQFSCVNVIQGLLRQFSDATTRRDHAAVMELFVRDPTTMLVGSESGEVATGPREIAAFFTRTFDRPHTYSWRIDRIDVFSLGTGLAHYAEGCCGIGDAATRAWMPYRISGLVQISGDTAQWKLFHGSEPADHKGGPRTEESASRG